MKTTLFLLSLMIVLIHGSQLNCLLEEPLTNDCLLSLQLSTIQQQMMPYLCIIALERSLAERSLSFCRQAAMVNTESGYRYFQALLLNNKYQLAFSTQYTLFFTNPFNHNKEIINVLNQTNQTLTAFQLTAQFQSLSDYQQSIHYFYQNKTQKSQHHLKTHLQQTKDKTLIYQHFLMCRILQKEYKYYDGLQYISDILVKNTYFHPYLYHLKGNFLMHHVQFQKAIREYEKANAQFDKLYSSKGFSFSNYNIGLCYEKLGKIQDSLKYYKQSIINLNSAQALNALGHAYFSLYQQNKGSKNLENAEQYYLKSIELNKEYSLAIFNLGMVYLIKKDNKKAIYNFEKCINMENAFRSCKYGLIKSYYQLKDQQKANQIIEGIQKNEETLSELAAILYQLQDHQKALTLLAHKDDYKSLQLMQWKGFNEYAVGQYQAASKSFARAIFLGSKKGYIYYSLGLSQLQQKLFQQCFNSFDTAYKLDPRKQTKEKREECQKDMKSLQL